MVVKHSYTDQQIIDFFYDLDLISQRRVILKVARKMTEDSKFTFVETRFANRVYSIIQKRDHFDIRKSPYDEENISIFIRPDFSVSTKASDMLQIIEEEQMSDGC